MVDAWKQESEVAQLQHEAAVYGMPADTWLLLLLLQLLLSLTN